MMNMILTTGTAMLPIPDFRTHQDVLRYHQEKYTYGVENGLFVPLTYPMLTWGAVLLVLYLLTPQLHSVAGRYITFALSSGWHLFLILNCKAYGAPAGFGIGIVAAWGILWAAVVLIFDDGAADWKRVKREVVIEASNGKPIGPQSTYLEDAADSPASGLRRRVGGYEKQTLAEKSPEPPAERSVVYRWQTYPKDSLSERVEWCVDLLTSFRGIGWSWKISGLPSRSRFVEESLNRGREKGEQHFDVKTSRAGIHRFDDYWPLMLHNIRLAVVGWLTLDLIKTIMSHDPYFWGLTDLPPPAYFPFSLVRDSFALTRTYRLIVSMSIMWMGLRTIFTLAPLVFVGLLGERWLGSNGEPWMYPDQYGSYSNVLTRGLSGWWGGWWHQMFRFAFQEGGRWAADGLRLEPGAFARTVTQTIVAFALSGFLHAAGSTSMIGETRPWSGSFLFFMLQPFGILAQTGWRRLLRRLGVQDAIPWWVGYACNFAYVHAWLFCTAPLLADDFAKGGIYHFEPVMFSPLRGLGFGGPGDGFLCWEGRLFGWSHDKRWWVRGVAL